MTKEQLFREARTNFNLEIKLSETREELAALKAKAPWEPAVGDSCLMAFSTFTPEPCTVLCLHQDQAWVVGAGGKALTVDVARLAQAKEQSE